ncbi:MAG: ABC transporter permease [Chloroflexi bacterium]|nr:ABC transporter permease [Chloroflexota bacterium]
MIRYVGLRIVATIPSLLGATFVLFSLLRFLPGDPAYTILLSMIEPGSDASQITRRDVEVLQTQLGLRDPYPVQYVHWLESVLSGNLGTSFRSRRPVVEELASRLPATLELAGAALVVMLLIAVPTGILGALAHGRPLDHLTRAIALVGVSTPSFFLGLLLMYVVAYQLNLLPAIGRDDARSFVLPALTLGAGLAATLSRLLRASLLDVLAQPYMLMAEAKGLDRRTIVFKHALRNALLPVVTSFGLTVGGLLGGAAIVETIFSWPGVGRYVVDAIAGRDYPVIQGFTLVMALAYTIVNLSVDVLYRFMDPRVRLETTVDG